MFSYIFLFLSLLFSSLSFATAVSQDPCDNLPGIWSGTYQNVAENHCSWNVQVNVSYNKNVIRMQLQGSKGRPRKPCSSTFVMVFTGSCHDGKLVVTSNERMIYQSMVFPNFTHLVSASSEITLNKLDNT